jgi:monovalent cation/hydrogen antiporter
MLPAVIRALGLAHAGRLERHANTIEEYEARRQGIDAAIEHLDRLASERGLFEDVVQPVRAYHHDRLKYTEHRSEGHEDDTKCADLRDEIELLLIAAERQRINQLFRSGKLKDEARRRIERELDLREAHVDNQRTAE